jgi:anti-anti-sigma regulatory factor
MKLEAKNAMLRIAIRSTQDQDTWILEGRLAGQVVHELSDAWNKPRSERHVRKSVVDLVNVTVVDELGEKALAEMMADGAEFVVRGVYTKSLLQSLSKGRKREA